MLQELFDDFKREKTYINGVAKKTITWYWCSFEAYKRVLNGSGQELPTKQIRFGTQLKSITVGDTVQVGFAEKSGQMEDGTPYTSRIVRNFDKDLGNGRKNYQANQPQNSQPGASQRVVNGP